MGSMLRSALYGALRSSSVVLSPCLPLSRVSTRSREGGGRLDSDHGDRMPPVTFKSPSTTTCTDDIGPGQPQFCPRKGVVARARLLNEFGAKTRELLIGDGT